MIKELFIFISGIGIGSAVTYYYTKNKCQEDAELEVETLRNYYNKKYSQTDISEREEKNEPDDSLKSLISGYSSLNETPEDDNEEPDYSGYISPAESADIPVVIDEHAFSYENLHYDKVDLIVWKDGVVTDSSEDIIDDVDSVVGVDNIDFRKNACEDGYIYIRNDSRGVDYVLSEGPLDYHEFH